MPLTEPLVAQGGSWDLFVQARDLLLSAKLPGGSKAVGQSVNDDYDKFRLPTGSGLPEDILEGGARPFITDVEFGRSGSQCFP